MRSISFMLLSGIFLFGLPSITTRAQTSVLTTNAPGISGPGMVYSATYPQGDLGARISACVADAIIGANGATQHVCSSEGEPTVASIYSQINIGDPNGDFVTWIHPAVCQWDSTAFTNGKYDMIHQYSGSEIRGASPWGGCKISNHNPAGGAHAMYQTDPGNSPAPYFHMGDLNFQSFSHTSSGAVVITASGDDGSLWHDLIISANSSGDTSLQVGSPTSTSPPCCQATWERIEAGGNLQGGVSLKIINSIYGAPTNLHFISTTFGRPAIGYPNIDCEDFTHTTTVSFDGLYGEMNNSDTTTPYAQSNGCAAISVSKQDVRNLLNVNSTAPIWQLNGTFATNFTIHNLSLYPSGSSGPGFVLPATAVRNNLSATCGSMPCNIMTDGNGQLGQFSTGIISGSLTAPLLTPVSSSAPCVAGQFTFDSNYHYVCTATNVWKRSALMTF